MREKIRFLSLNVGMKSDLAGLITLIQVHKLDIILLQEVRISEEQLNQKIINHGFTGKVSIDAEDLMKPGVALIWRTGLPVREIITLVACRAQLLFLGDIAVVTEDRDDPVGDATLPHCIRWSVCSHRAANKGWRLS